jgi:hypothetical protein
MPDRFGAYICCSKHPGGRIPVSGMDIPGVKGIDAVRSAGDWVYCRLVIEIAQG